MLQHEPFDATRARLVAQRCVVVDVGENVDSTPAMLAQIEKGETANAAALTTVHLQTVLNQINLQLTKYDAAETTPRSSGRTPVITAVLLAVWNSA